MNELKSNDYTLQDKIPALKMESQDSSVENVLQLFLVSFRLLMR